MSSDCSFDKFFGLLNQTGNDGSFLFLTVAILRGENNFFLELPSMR